jgi:hypothetical protein
MEPESPLGRMLAETLAYADGIDPVARLWADLEGLEAHQSKPS